MIMFQIEAVIVKYDNIIEYSNKLDIEKVNVETFIVGIEEQLLQWENAESNQIVDDEINTIKVCRRSQNSIYILISFVLLGNAKRIVST